MFSDRCVCVCVCVCVFRHVWKPNALLCTIIPDQSSQRCDNIQFACLFECHCSTYRCDFMVLWSNVKSFCAKNKLSIVRSTITRTALLELDITAIGFDNAYYLS